MGYSVNSDANWEIEVSGDKLAKGIGDYCNSQGIITNATADPQAALDGAINTACNGTLAQTQAVLKVVLKALTDAKKKTRP